MSTEDRRAPGTARMPFDGLVEVGGAMGPSFEAQAINVSEDGMLLRTAYLPEAGQPLTCRFDAGGGASVLASGEVVWAQGAEKGGEFAIRFTDMDPESVDALKRACGVGEAPMVQVVPGSKVRLHIDGLASPMRAKIKDAHSSEITVGSDLGFLQVGKQLELEDAQSGQKRPAAIDRVEVAVDPTSNVPQLVVTLRYSDVQADVDAARGASEMPSRAPSPSQAKDADVNVEVDEASMQMKGTLARSFSKVGPAFERFTKRAKTTIALLAARRMMRSDSGEVPRRTTAPAPGGGLHTSGRKVIRGEAGASSSDIPMKKPLGITKQKAMIAGGVMALAIVGAVILKKSHHETPATTATTDGPAATATQVAAETTPPPPAPIPNPVAAPPPRRSPPRTSAIPAATWAPSRTTTTTTATAARRPPQARQGDALRQRPGPPRQRAPPEDGWTHREHRGRAAAHRLRREAPRSEVPRGRRPARRAATRASRHIKVSNDRRRRWS